jgi:hypothetical protein
MTTLPPWLEEKRDDPCNVEAYHDINGEAYDAYRNGFTDCHALMREEMQVLVDELEALAKRCVPSLRREINEVTARHKERFG